MLNYIWKSFSTNAFQNTKIIEKIEIVFYKLKLTYIQIKNKKLIKLYKKFSTSLQNNLYTNYF